MLKQRTVREETSILGKGLHSGNRVSMNIKPAPPNSGITFVRNDLSGKPKIKVDVDNIGDGFLATTLNVGRIQVKTVEHFLSALYALGVDNLIVELDSPEVPIMDGSARPFIYLLRRDVGIKEQKAAKKFIKITKRVEVSDDDKYLRVEPVDAPRLLIDFTIFFPHRVIGIQNYLFEFSTRRYIEEISKARTFVAESEVKRLWKKGYALGGSLDNAVVVGDFGILNKDDLRYENEFVRHKILDIIGDLYLLGSPVFGKVVAYKSGHTLNHMLVKKVVQEKAYEIVTLPLEKGEKIFNFKLEPAFFTD